MKEQTEINNSILFYQKLFSKNNGASKQNVLQYLCTRQKLLTKQAILKLIEKKDNDKRFIKNWRPISLFNVDVRLISKVLSGRIKNDLILSNQNAYVISRFIWGGRLISDTSEMTDILNMEGYL